MQDEASQLVVELLAQAAGARVSGAPRRWKGRRDRRARGTSGSVLALDRNERRLDLVRRTARRLRLANLACRAVDASRALPEGVANGGFDRVLVDAPCSGLGALRRNPDARWRVHPSDPGRLADTQRGILRNAISALRPGGTLALQYVYAAARGERGRDRGALRERKGARTVGRDAAPAALRELPDERGFLRTLPQQHDADGFFAARLERRA